MQTATKGPLQGEAVRGWSKFGQTPKFEQIRGNPMCVEATTNANSSKITAVSNRSGGKSKW